MPPVIIFGASGFIGGHLRKEAHASRLRFLSVVRSPKNLTPMSGESVASFEDLIDCRIKVNNWRGASVINLIGPTTATPIHSTWNTIVSTTEEVLKIARQLNASRIVYISGFGVTELTTSVYFGAKAKAEQLIRCAGIPYDILRCSYILGEGDELTPSILRQLARGFANIPGDGFYRLQPLSVSDVSKILLKACQQDNSRSETHNLLGEQVSYYNFVRLLRGILFPAAAIRSISLEYFVRRAITTSDPEFSLEELAILICDKVGESTGHLFHIRVKGIREIVDDLAALYRRH